jgi:hypothetical protein
LKDPLRLTPAPLVAVLLALSSPETAHAKRRPPAEIEPVVKNGIRYVVPHFGALHGKEQNGGYVQAFQVKSGKLLWDRMVYRVVQDATLEGDAQDVFIVRIGVGDAALFVEDELGNTFEMDLASGHVRALVGKSGRTRAPLSADDPP